MPTQLSPPVQQVLRQAHYAAHVQRLFLPREELEPNVYREVKAVCTRLGGRWNTASQSFLFASDPTEALAWVCESGTMPPNNPDAFFPTPESVSEDLLRAGFELFGCTRCEGYHHGQPLHWCHYLPAQMRILEPSAGQGAITRWVRQMYAALGREDYTLHCCEVNPINQAILRRQGFQIVASNFLDYHLAADESPYDVILMNPPFRGTEYVEHLEHAWSMLNPREGQLVAVTPTGWTWRTDAACRRLSALVCRYHDETPTFYPAGRFKESGTPVNTMLLSLVKRDLSWQDEPFEGYPDWHCFMLDFFLTQTQSLAEQRRAIWLRMEHGELPDDPAQPGWEQTHALLAALFAQAVEQARKAWVAIRWDEREQKLMERVFLAQGAQECQCDRQAALRQQGFRDVQCEPFPDVSLMSRVVEEGSVQPGTNENGGATSLSSPLPAPAACVQLTLFPVPEACGSFFKGNSRRRSQGQEASS